jgi:hypothetical protein
VLTKVAYEQGMNERKALLEMLVRKNIQVMEKMTDRVDRLASYRHYGRRNERQGVLFLFTSVKIQCEQKISSMKQKNPCRKAEELVFSLRPI